MYRVIRWINQNREIAVIVAIIIILFFAVIYSWNGVLEKRKEENKTNTANIQTNTESTSTSTTNTSVITGDAVKASTDTTNTSLISKFVEYCNEGKTDEAYNMLSNECKELLYPSLEDFETNYYSKIFYLERNYNLETWYTSNGFYVYYITYKEDILSTGNTNSSENIGDYITVTSQDDGQVINISSYVGRKEISKSETEENVTITINYIDMYIDYTIVNISAENNLADTICLDSKENTESMYLYDENGVEYTALLNEIAEKQLTIASGQEKEVNIKFNKIYNPERDLEGICLLDIVINYEEYLSDTEIEKEIIEMRVKI